MSRNVEKKNSIVMNSTGGGNREITKGNISFIIPNEQPNQNEATVTIDIKDIRFGQASVTIPEITAIVNGSKVVSTVPFKEPLHYHFKRIEDEMVFKFAVTSAGDLLGFVYFELPHRYKAMKKFHLDEWVPVKHLSSEENDKLTQENFVARIVVDYKGLRRLEDPKDAPKQLKAQMLEDLAKNMKQTVNNINEEIEVFGDEGFKHLAIFERKLLKKKINLSARAQDPRKQIKAPPGEAPIGDSQKDVFYRTRGAMGETMEVKAQALNPGQFFDKTVNVSKVGKEASANCSRCENLTKELQFSHKELTQAHQKITGLEQGKVVVDNERLRKDLEKLQAELNKDRKEINIKLKDNSTLLEQETKKIRKHYEAETGKALSQQSEAKLYIEDLRAKLRLLEGRENTANSQDEELLETEARIAAKEAQVDQEATNLDYERLMLEEEEVEMTEMKTRMMLERQRVCEEANALQFLKGDTELRQKQMAAMEAYLNEEKEQFRKYVDRKTAEIEEQKRSLEAVVRHQDDGSNAFRAEQGEYEKKNNELLEAIGKHRQELAKFNREKKMHLAHLGEFSNDKTTIDSERAEVMKEIEKDYEYLEEKNRLLTEQKAELERLMKQLDDYEASLQNQNRLQQEQHERFIIQQKQFFKKLSSTNFEPKEIRKLAEEVGAAVNQVDETYEEAQKRERELARGRNQTKKNIESIAESTLREAGELDQGAQPAVERRTTGKLRETASVVTSMQAQDKIKIQQDAFKLVDKIFSNAVMGAFKKQNQQKDELIENLKGSVQKLETRLKDMHKRIKNSKLSFFTSKGMVSQKVKVVSNPFANKGLNELDGTRQQEVVGEKEVEVPGMGEHADRLAELQEQVEDLCDQSIKTVNELSGGKQSGKAKERIEYLIQMRKAVQGMFGLVKRVNAGSHIDDGEAPRFEYDNFDLERLKANLEAKLQELVLFISKVKKSNDFFNPNMDNEILAS